ncbi:DUF2332 domain-containing protein [Kibdelosporangium aridum]|uniref:DUF2332 domain-containing protein n=1 Tax=Kibdelosporangium aridum TaxID=2030 RepID=A0A428ZFS5_KIBAR|nr:DUF2332 domain-containing protein [Kibdelosporangium aridum]RSM86915.1 DUF2332 domain-containing protein [Kibdelosporangium aridum]
MMASLELAKARLTNFAVNEAAGISPLYELLATHAKDDDEVAALLAAAPENFAHGTLFFAAAQRLVQAEPWIELANYYLTMGGSFGPDERVWPLFRQFVLGRADKMRELISTRTTQTNEVRRVATMFPAIAQAAKQAKGPIGLLEVGTSAGLLLGVDRYGYRYSTEAGEQINAGPTKTPLVLTCAVSGQPLPKLPKKLAVAAKVGLDRRPIDLRDEEELAWLEACVWADQPERSRRLRVAAEMQEKDRPTLVTGDAVDGLADAAAQVPAELPLVVLTSHVLPYLADERRQEFVAALASLAATRPLWWVSQEHYLAAMTYLVPGRTDFEDSFREIRGVLALVRWESGKPDARLLGRTGAHGQTLTWL